jgi:hypothetical protein
LSEQPYTYRWQDHDEAVARVHAVPSVPPSIKKETRVVDPVTGGEKGAKQAMLGAIDPNALNDLALVAGFGAIKYAPFNYAKGYAWSLSYNALLRHVLAFLGGEDTDPESELPHLAHASWHCMTLLTFSRFNRGTDDRFPLREQP